MHTLFTLPPVSSKDIVKKREAGEPDITVLKPQQKMVFDAALNYLLKPAEGPLVISGVSGSGKTFVVSRIIEKYLQLRWANRIGFSATTNKAVKVAYRSTEFTHPALSYHTIHSLLGLKEQIQKDGSIDFVPDKYKEPAIKEFQVVPIDEASMFSAKLWKYLLPYMNSGIKIIFIGDPFQTPPVKERDSIIFNAAHQKEHNMTMVELTDIIRQAADNPIIKVATIVRNNIREHIDLCKIYKHKDKLWQTDKGVSFIDRRHNKQHFDELLKHIFTSANFKADANFGKVISWRNNTVNAINDGVRRMIYGEGKLRRIEVGEKLVTKQPVFDLDMDMIKINNAEELEVVEFSEKTEHINGGQYNIDYFDTTVRFYDIFGNIRQEYINIPTIKGTLVYDEVLEMLSSIARRYTPGTLPATTAWREFYRFQKTFANINYNYAGTTHTSQGSTYDNCIVMQCDIIKNRQIMERNRILYTAITRPSERLFIV